MSIYAVNGKVPVASWIPSRDTAGNGTTTLNDLVGTNHGTLTGMDAATDWVSDTSAGGVRALDFDGVNDFVSCPSINVASITVSAWVRFTTDVSHVFLAKRSNTAYSWEIGRNAGNDQLMFRINDNTNVATGGNLTLDTWHHVCGTYNATTIVAYLNGISVGTLAYSTAIASNAVGITLGARANFPGAEAFLPLRLDDMRIFNTALNASDVAQLYRNGNGRGVTANSNTFQIGMPI